MTERKDHRIARCLLALLLAFCAGLSAWTFLLHRVLTDEALYREAARSALPERRARFEERIRALAGEAGFIAETALSFYPEERQRRIAEDGAAWTLTMLRGVERDAPDTAAVREETGEKLEQMLAAELPGSRFRSEARAQELAARVERLASRSLLPMRGSLLGIADRELSAHRGLLAKLLRYLDLAGWALAGLALLCGVLLCLIWRLDRYGLACAGAGLAAGGLGGAAILLPALAMNVPGLLREVSASFAAETQWILGRLTLRHLILCGILFAAGLAAFLAGRAAKGHRHEA